MINRLLIAVKCLKYCRCSCCLNILVKNIFINVNKDLEYND